MAKDAPAPAPVVKVAEPLTTHETEAMRKAMADQRHDVEVGFTVYSVSCVDPVTETFSADLKVYCRWHDGAMEHDPDMVAMHARGEFANGAKFSKDATGRYHHNIAKEIDPKLVEKSRPRWSFTNAVEVVSVDKDPIIYLSPNDPLGWVRYEKRFRGTFFEEMELHSFPFDAQELHITLRLPRRKDSGRHFTQYMNSRGPQAELKDWVRLPEWTRYEATGRAGTDSKGRAKYTVTIPLIRQSSFYIWSVLSVMSSIGLLGFTAFIISAEDLPGRSSVVLTLMLTAVAFKFSIAENLPKVAYWTTLDLYMNTQYAMLLLIGIANAGSALVANVTPDVFAVWGGRIELYTFLFVFVLWIAFHVWFVLHVQQLCKASLEQMQSGGRLPAIDAAKKRYEEQQAAKAKAANANFKEMMV